MEGIPFSSSYTTAVWLGHTTGMWERKVWTSWSCGSSCADWQRPRTLSAMLEESIPHHQQPHPPPCPSWLLSTCGGHHGSHSELAEPNFPVPQLLQGKSPASSQKWLMEAGAWESAQFLHKSSWDEHPWWGSSDPLGGTDLWQRYGNRERGICETAPGTGSRNANQSHDIS